MNSSLSKRSYDYDKWKSRQESAHTMTPGPSITRTVTVLTPRNIKTPGSTRTQTTARSRTTVRSSGVIKTSTSTGASKRCRTPISTRSSKNFQLTTIPGVDIVGEEIKSSSTNQEQIRHNEEERNSAKLTLENVSLHTARYDRVPKSSQEGFTIADIQKRNRSANLDKDEITIIEYIKNSVFFKQAG